MLLRKNGSLHAPWVLLAVGLILIAAIWHYTASRQAGVWLGGSSLVGLVVGSVAGLIIFGELLLWPRKRLRRYRLGPTRVWLAAHLWLGLAVFPLAWIHAGYRFGGGFSSVLMWITLFVTVSGLWGWLMQILLPRWMLEHLPAETIASQVPQVSAQLARDARQLLVATCGLDPSGQLEERLSIAADPPPALTVVGALRQRGAVQGKTLASEVAKVPAAEGVVLWRQFQDVVEPFLADRIPAGTPLATERTADLWFDRLRSTCSGEGREVVDRLAELCSQRRQLQQQRTVHWWLHGWIALHAAASVALGWLLIVHIYLAIRYW